MIMMMMIITRMRNGMLVPSPNFSLSKLFNMDEFENAFQGGEDPAAEFLAREQSELEELGIEDQLGVQQVRIVKWCRPVW